MPVSKFWNEEKVETVKRMWSEGASGEIIALAIGCSRSTVLGKIHRLRKQTAHGPERRERARIVTMTTPSRIPLKVRRQQPGGNTMGIMAALRRKAITELPAEIVENPVSFSELKQHHCRWPVDGEGLETLFCGANAVDRMPYCACHCMRAYAVRRAMTRAEYELHQRALVAAHKAKVAA